MPVSEAPPDVSESRRELAAQRILGTHPMEVPDIGRLLDELGGIEGNPPVIVPPATESRIDSILGI
jgi:hypothetical protein